MNQFIFALLGSGSVEEDSLKDQLTLEYILLDRIELWRLQHIAMLVGQLNDLIDLILLEFAGLIGDCSLYRSNTSNPTHSKSIKLGGAEGI